MPQNPQQTWLRCQCEGCKANGRPAGTETLGGCSTTDCTGASADLAQQCQAICAGHGLTSCTSAAPLLATFCEPNRCEFCTTQSCSVGHCFLPARICSIECATNANCGQCDACDLTQGQVGACVPQRAGAMCTQSQPLLAAPSYLDRYSSRVSSTLATTSTFHVSADKADGTGSLTEGSVRVLAVGCPGPSCAMRLNDLYARTNAMDLSVTIIDPFGIAIKTTVTLNDLVVTNVKPTTLNAQPDGSFTIPANGLELMAALTAKGQRSRGRVLNDTEVTGSVDLTTGAVALQGQFTLEGATVSFNLGGQIDNMPPHANAGVDQTVECTGTTTTVTLNGSASSDLPPGPGIVEHRWFEGFDHVSGAGNLVALGALAPVALPLGTKTFTLQVADGEGALDMDDVVVKVRDTTPPVLTAGSSTVNVCTTGDQLVTIALPTVTEVCQPGGFTLQGEVISRNGTAISPPVPLVNGQALLAPGQVVVRWTATDNQGNPAIPLLQTITIQVQTNAQCCLPGQTMVVGTSQADILVKQDAHAYCLFGRGERDQLQTSTLNDYLSGDDGDDIISSLGGNDVLVGGAGQDILQPGPGNVKIFGGADADQINASAATTAEIYGNEGDDQITGSPGADFIVPGPGRDVVNAGDGNDTVVIRNLCEAVSGKSLDGGRGTNTLRTPVPLSTLQARGVTVKNFQNIVIDTSKVHLSECF